MYIAIPRTVSADVCRSGRAGWRASRRSTSGSRGAQLLDDPDAAAGRSRRRRGPPSPRSPSPSRCPRRSRSSSAARPAVRSSAPGRSTRPAVCPCSRGRRGRRGQGDQPRPAAPNQKAAESSILGEQAGERVAGADPGRPVTESSAITRDRARAAAPRAPSPSPAASGRGRCPGSPARRPAAARLGASAAIDAARVTTARPPMSVSRRRGPSPSRPITGEATTPTAASRSATTGRR